MAAPSDQRFSDAHERFTNGDRRRLPRARSRREADFEERDIISHRMRLLGILPAREADHGV